MQKARDSLQTARESLQKAEAEISEKLNVLRSSLEEIEVLNKRMAVLQSEIQDVGSTVEGLSKPSQQLSDDATPVTQPSPTENDGDGSPIKAIRDVIASGSYEWTTIGRIMRKTGLSHETSEHIKIGRGKSSKDFIFEFI